MSNPNPPEPPARAPRWLRWLFLPALAAWVWFQVSHATTAAGGTDPSGYLNAGRLIASGRLSLEQRIPAEIGAAHDPEHFLPLGFWMAPERPGFIVPTYPVGLPLQFAAAGLLAGWEAGPWLVIVGNATAALVLLYLSARELGVSPPLAAAGPAVLALSPQFQFSSFLPMSDTPATAWCLAAFWTALRARRGGTPVAVLCGLAVAMAVLVRPTNALLVPSLAILLGERRRLLAAAAGGLPVAVFLLWLNHRLYGHPLSSGYGDVLAMLGLHWVQPTAAHFARWLVRLLPAALLVLPFAALLEWRTRRRVLAALAWWWATLTGFYALYSVSHESWWCLRFILPAFPALILAALLGAEALCACAAVGYRRLTGPAAAAGLALWAAAGFAFSSVRADVLHLHHVESAYREAAVWLRDHLPDDALIVTFQGSGSVYYYTHFPVLRWDLITAERYRTHAAALRRAGRPVYALLFPQEEQRALQGGIADRWEKLAGIAGISVWKLAPAP